MIGRSFPVFSAGRKVIVHADERLAQWWPLIAPHIPGTTVALPPALDPMASPVACDADLTGLRTSGDARRVINAHLHRVHLEHRAVCVHGVTLADPDSTAAVVLLGGHGAGKTLVAMALAGRGWLPMAGDVTILGASPPGAPLDHIAGVADAAVAVLGGTRAFAVRAAAVRRWFPAIEIRRPVEDLSGQWPAPEPGDVPVTGAVMVHVDGDPQLSAEPDGLDAHTAASAWWHASGHLLDRWSDDAPPMWRLIEDAGHLHDRAVLVRALATRVRLTRLRGDPHGIAAAIDSTHRATCRTALTVLP